MKEEDAYKFPVEFCKTVWPQVNLYKQQREILCSVRDNNETIVVAGNMLGKDFVAGLAVLWFFLTRHPCRIVTTSVKDPHLNVLWGEIGRFIQESKYPLVHKKGGSLIVNHHRLKKVFNGQICPLSEVTGQVAKEGESMQGEHIAQTGDGIPRTLFVVDEASGVPEIYYTMATTWANRILVIGNPWPCDNFFRYSVDGRPGTKDKGGDLKAPDNGHLYRKIIKIKATDSPNIKLALSQKRRGQKPTNEIIIPGVKPYDIYLKDREMWDKVHQCVSLDAEFYKGADVLMFPPEWLNRAEQLYDAQKNRNRKAEAIGIDPAEGGDYTAMYAIDKLGIIEGVEKKTPDTSVITGETIAFMQKHGVQARDVYFDAGGGGQQHVDRLRAQGYNVKAVRFGEAATPEKRRGMIKLEIRVEQDEVRYVYKNRRIEMYWLLRLMLDPNAEGSRFAISSEEVKLRQQLAPIPVLTDGEGRLLLPPKRKPATNTGKESTTQTMIDLIGHSPDRADALVLAVFGLQNRRVGQGVGVW